MPRRSVPRHGSFEYFFDRANYTVAPAGTATVTVSLRETFNPRTDQSLLMPGTDGLVSAGVVLQIGALNPGDADYAPKVAVALGNTAFDFATVVRSSTPEFPGSAGITQLATRPVFGEVVARTPTCVSVLLPLGTFTFAAPADAGDVTFLTALVADDYPDTCDENNVTHSGTVLDPWIQPGSAMITVAAKLPAPRAVNASSAADAILAMSRDLRRHNH
jgi:hypothetical protein